ncbi:hypothetical protein P3T40_003881 [Paraburkholderia sp. EB58]|jgi:hypothetical protein
MTAGRNVPIDTANTGVDERGFPVPAAESVKAEARLQ